MQVFWKLVKGVRYRKLEVWTKTRRTKGKNTIKPLVALGVIPFSLDGFRYYNTKKFWTLSHTYFD